jgi:hypothetical protein
MTVTKLVGGFAIVVVGLLCWLAAAGNPALAAVLVTGAALVVLVGGGNWLSGRSHGSAATPNRDAPPSPAEPDDPAASTRRSGASGEASAANEPG